jgi:hypothetical protein
MKMHLIIFVILTICEIALRHSVFYSPDSLCALKKSYKWEVNNETNNIYFRSGDVSDLKHRKC